MMSGSHLLAVSAFVVAVLLCGCAHHDEVTDRPRNHHETGYIPWGVDEFQLYGQTKEQLAKNFKSELTFSDDYSEAYLGHLCFLLTFNDDRVSSVRRAFHDGAGCFISGPQLRTEREALQFSIDGLSRITNPTDGYKATLALAKRRLAALDASGKVQTSTPQAFDVTAPQGKIK
jgi:hypothetical protein